MTTKRSTTRHAPREDSDWARTARVDPYSRVVNHKDELAEIEAALAEWERQKYDADPTGGAPSEY